MSQIFKSMLNLFSRKSKNKITSSIVNHSKKNRQYDKLLENYWFEEDVAKRFHSFNRVRVPLIYNNYVVNGLLEFDSLKPCNHFRGIKILDVSCAGGLCTEKLAELNFDVTGIETNPELIEVAEHHKKFNTSLAGKSLRYYHSSVEEFAAINAGNFDAVIISDALEYVSASDKKKFLDLCIRCCKDEGDVFITAMNKTFQTLFWVVMFRTEPNFRTVPLNWFHGINPLLLTAYLRDIGCCVRSIKGLRFNPEENQFIHWDIPNPWYFVHAIKRS